MKELAFIDVRDVGTDRKSSISIHGRQDDPPALTIIGNLEHQARIIPASKRDAENLIKWLNWWIASQP